MLIYNNVFELIGLHVFSVLETFPLCKNVLDKIENYSKSLIINNR